MALRRVFTEKKSQAAPLLARLLATSGTTTTSQQPQPRPTSFDAGQATPATHPQVLLTHQALQYSASTMRAAEQTVRYPKDDLGYAIESRSGRHPCTSMPTCHYQRTCSGLVLLHSAQSKAQDSALGTGSIQRAYFIEPEHIFVQATYFQPIGAPLIVYRTLQYSHPYN